MSEEKTTKKRSHASANSPDGTSRSKKHDKDGRHKKKARYEVHVHQDQSQAPSSPPNDQPPNAPKPNSTSIATQTIIPPAPAAASAQKSDSHDPSKPHIPALPPLPDDNLERKVFTHSSVDATENYERLELLGDAYLEIIAVRLVYDRFPTHTPKHLSQIREKLVCNNTLNFLAGHYRLYDRIRSQGTHETTADKMVADVMEAYIAAVILADPLHGFETAEKWLRELWAPMLDSEGSFATPATKGGVDTDAKDKLNRLVWCKPVRIEYRTVPLKPNDRKGVKGQALAQLTRVSVLVRWEGEKEVEVASAVGIGKKEAGLKAAEAAVAKQDSEPVRGLAQRKTQNEEARKARQAQQTI